MKKRILSCFLALVLALSLLPMSVLAAGSGEGLTPDNPMEVPADAMVIHNKTYYGVSKEWFASVNPDKGTLYVSLQIPNTVENIANDAFRDNYTGDKAKYGALNSNDKLGQCKVAAIDFSQATNLTTIRYQAAMYCSDISGVLDLSNTKVETIEKSAFSGCTGLTGVILPDTLKNLTTPGQFNDTNGKVDPTDPVGSVFNGCSNLKFVRTDGGNANATFELPDGLKVIGRQSFKGCTGLPSGTTVAIPQSVTLVGSEVFHYTPSVTTIVVKTNDASNYNGNAFKTSGSYGLGNRLTVFNNSAAKNSFTPSGSNSYANSLTYEFTLHYGDGENSVTEPKLYGQAVNVCKAEDGSWAANENYKIPEVQPGSVPTGYEGGWAYNNELLTPKTVLKPIGDDLYLAVQNVLQKPTVEFIVNGNVAQDTDSGVPELTVEVNEDTPGSVGVQVTHPLATEEAKESGTYVYFKYCWWDEKGNSVNGPRSETEPDLFSTAATSSSYHRVFTDQNVIPIRNTDDTRTDGDYYLVEIYGYYVENNEKPKQYYKSGHNFIAGDNANDRSFVMNVDVVDTTPVAITPADITVYTGGEGYTGAVDNAGHESTTANGLPEPGYYITLPDWINDQLGGNANAENLSKILKFTYKDDQGQERVWKLELYGTDAHSSNVEGTDRQRYIYRMLPGVDENGQEIPVRLKFTDSDGNATISDEFTPNMEEQFQKYTMSIYSGGLQTNKITANLTLPDGKVVTCGVNSAEGNLVVRGLTGEDTTTKIISNEADLSGSGVTALALDGVTYYVNGSNVELKDTEGVKLLVDDVLDDGVLVKYIQDSMTEKIPAGDYAYAQQYLDLVDTQNGNAYLTMGKGQNLTIYWKAPDDLDRDKPFYVVHFDALDRNYSKLEDELTQNTPDLLESKLVTVNGTQYVKFDTSSFSPFVLVYEKTQTPPDPTTRYRIEASAGPGGSINPEGIVRVSEGGSQHFTITPDEGYKILDVVVDGKSVGPVDEYTFKNVREWHTIEVTFTKLPANPDDSGVSDWLDTENHMAYLNGYPGEVFGPRQNMTRAEAAQMFYNLLLEKNVPITVSFTDVNDNAWYAKAVNTLASLGMIQGVEGNRFEPDRSITRAEFTAIAMRFTDGDTKGENIFSDVHPNQWFYDEVVGSIQYGWINGYEDDTFRPNNTITRAEVATITNRMLDREADRGYVDAHTDELRLFSDVDKGYWAYYTIVEASNAHEYTKDHNNEFWK